MSLIAIPAWIDQDLVLYHGTVDGDASSILVSVDETKGGLLKDFGRGFYTTSRLDKAFSWAKVKSQRKGGTPAVLDSPFLEMNWHSLMCCSSQGVIRTPSIIGVS